MQYKRYEARTLKEALSRVKKELGPNALILSTRSFRKDGGMLSMLGRRWVEVTAAVDHDLEHTGSRAAVLEEPAPDKVEVENATHLARGPGRICYALHPASYEEGYDPFCAPDRRGEWCFLLSQLGFREEFLELFRALEAQGVDIGIALNLLERVRAALGSSPCEDSGQGAREVLEELLGKEIDIIDPDPRWDGGPQLMVMMGPTGVGKTTTVAKLAARFALMQGRKVALATLDTYRIGAVEQLRIYADVMDLPLEVIHYPRDLDRMLKKYQHFDLILMDTAGRSPNNDQHLQDLKDSQPGYHQVHNYLLVSASTQEWDMVRTVERFSVVDLKALIITKVDECSRLGPVFNLVYRSDLPLAYLTTGQKVPDDLEPARPGSLLGRMLPG